ncbi:MAG: imidazole glycerol phosphate synthase subunit HisH [Clostridia bacterium]|nr:imidazole glycerol phosphate synthase subunit HisH [Clostridia bacterium]
MIAIIDYGLGNVFSLSSSLRYLGMECEITRDPQRISAADRIILPGVGAYGDAMAKLNETGLIPILQEQAAQGKPFMGICLGMQLLFEVGYEYGVHRGLGLLPGNIRPLADALSAAGSTLKVPHMGWNALDICRPDYPLLKNTIDGEHVYFVHSYYATECDAVTLATAEYGLPVTAAVGRDNVCGCQFHPEKSGEVGLKILRAFDQM